MLSFYRRHSSVLQQTLDKQTSRPRAQALTNGRGRFKKSHSRPTVWPNTSRRSWQSCVKISPTQPYAPWGTHHPLSGDERVYLILASESHLHSDAMRILFYSTLWKLMRICLHTGGFLLSRDQFTTSNLLVQPRSLPGRGGS